MWAHPVTLFVFVVIGAAALGAVFGLLKALRGPLGALAYLGLIATFIAYWRMGDRYFTQGIWQISIGCLVVMGFTVRRVPFMRTVLAVAVIEFGSRITKTAYPKQTLIALGVSAAMIAIATFWTPRSAATAPPAPPVSPAFRPGRSGRSGRSGRPYLPGPPNLRGPERFDPYSGRPLPVQRNARFSPAALWRRTRGRR